MGTVMLLPPSLLLLCLGLGTVSSTCSVTTAETKAEANDPANFQGGEDYHAADWLTGTWLEEQLTGQRKLAGMINTFNNFKRGHAEMAEWMFDQEIGDQ